jgi:enoyl-CoA hydratase
VVAQELPTFKTIQLERVGAILKVTLDNPANEMNTVDQQVHDDLTGLFAYLRTESTARAIVLGARGKAFSAGGDFSWFPNLDDAGKLDQLRRHAKQLIWDLLDVEVPIVVAVGGPAVGLGASIALLCDIIFMSESASIADPHVRVGLVAGDGGAVIWPLVVGPALAKQYLLTGDAVSSADAARMGLVNKVVADDELEDAAMAFARRLAAGAPMALRYTKASVNKLIKDALNTAFDYSTAVEMLTFQSEDHKEALAAIAEKRKPDFKDR